MIEAHGPEENELIRSLKKGVEKSELRLLWLSGYKSVTELVQLHGINWCLNHVLLSVAAKLIIDNINCFCNNCCFNQVLLTAVAIVKWYICSHPFKISYFLKSCCFTVIPANEFVLLKG